MPSVTSLVHAALTQQIKQHSHCNIIIAYSGGVDSQVLLHAIAQLKKQQLNNNVTVCHVNHGLSNNAGQWLALRLIALEILGQRSDKRGITS